MRYRSLQIVLLSIFLNGCLAISTSTADKHKNNRDQEPVAQGQCPVAKSCPVTTQCSPITQKVCAAALPEHKMIIIGQVEYVDILPTGLRQKARIDTGAETTSVDAREVTAFERDGKPWVQFTVLDRVTQVPAYFKLPVERTVLIKRHGAENIRRYVVSMRLAIGDLRDSIEVSLANREQFDYPVLIGRNFMQGRAIVDVSRKFIALD